MENYHVVLLLSVLVLLGAVYVNTVGQGIVKIKDEIGKVKEDLESTRNELKQGKVDLESTTNELKQVKADLESTRNELKQGKVDLESTRNELKQEKVDLESTRNELKQLKIDLEEKDISRGKEIDKNIADVMALLKETNNRYEHTSNEIKKGQSSTYIRWGRSNCSGINTELVYLGYAAGEKHSWGSSYKGGASNMLCLPNNPELSDKAGSGSSYIFGTEFQSNQFAADSSDEDVPCSLCRSRDTASSVMIPGRKTCYVGWKEEYNGILAASAYSHTPSPYICVDAKPTYVNGGKRNNDDHLLYVTAMKCGSLPCPPYKDNVQVYCVVCSK